MPVSPIEGLTNMEGLSQNGETGKEQEESEEEESGDGTEDREEGRTSVGRRSPKEPTRMERGRSTRGHIAHTAFGANTASMREPGKGPHRNSTPVGPLEETSAEGAH